MTKKKSKSSCKGTVSDGVTELCPAMANALGIGKASGKQTVFSKKTSGMRYTIRLDLNKDNRLIFNYCPWCGGGFAQEAPQ